MRRVILGLIVCWMGCGSPVAEGGDCSSDAECKGDRVCDGGECVADSSAAADSGGQQGSQTTPSGAIPGARAGEFGAKCHDESECDSELCVYDTTEGGSGYCASWCDTTSECPANYDCQDIGRAARKACVPDDQLDACKANCEEYSFFRCVETSVAAECKLACEAATVAERKTFSECAGGETLGCQGTSCLDAFGVEVDAADTATSCQDTYEAREFCGGMVGYICSDNATPDDASCQFVGADGGEALFCCF